MNVALPGAFQSLISLAPLVAIFVLSRFAGKLNYSFLFRRAVALAIFSSFNALLFSYLRVEILLPFIVLILGFYLGANSLKPFFTISFVPIAIAIAFFFSIFELLGSYRENISTGFARLGQLNELYYSQNAVNEDPEYKLSAFDRSSNLAQLSAAVDLVDNYGPYQGEASAPLLVAFIPRFLWPEKPKIALGVWYALELGVAIEVDDWFNNSVNMTIPGQLYLDFGWIGLIIGSIFTGILLQLLWKATDFYSPTFNLLGTFYGVYLLFSAFTGIGADLQIFVTFIAVYLILLVISLVKP
ncbi:hypothetical protein GCM10008106_10150 [Mongoliitalea lutea]|uniref:Oligosaccharide repeat unit polymerase n=2 Tax=Mongoliitalea lutea TaxID=849756 RepID=A0A8J3CWZ9_9BACT|nr:hypothetical protein GCM10008106_10150 [Mongoliitalea lutea]